MNFLTQNNVTPVNGPATTLNDSTRKLFFSAGMIAILLGIFAFTFSTKGLATMSALFAIYTLFLAGLDVMLFTKSHELRGSFLVSALLSFVMGLTMLFRQDVTSEFLGLIFGFWVLFNAISILSQVWTPELLNSWYRIASIVIGFVGLLMGMYLTIFPNVAPNTQSIIVGIFVDLLGIYYLLIAVFSAKNATPSAE